MALEDLHIDHVTPVCAGGASDDANLRATHRGCNLRKIAADSRLSVVPRRPALLPDEPFGSRLLKVSEVAELVGVNADTVRRWVRAGRLRAVRLGDRAGFRIPESELARLFGGQQA